MTKAKSSALREQVREALTGIGPRRPATFDLGKEYGAKAGWVRVMLPADKPTRDAIAQALITAGLAADVGEGDGAVDIAPAHKPEASAPHGSGPLAARYSYYRHGFKEGVKATVRERGAHLPDWVRGYEDGRKAANEAAKRFADEIGYDARLSILRGTDGGAS
jgi:hypothetical protein